jgi:HPt (histidine-containing phosphotransfer) domain-containing protein
MDMIAGRTPSHESPHELAWSTFRTIGAQALQSNLRRLERLEDALEAAATGSLDEEERASASRAAHTLAGSAGTFGFLRATPAARRLEALFLAGDLTDRDVLAARGWVSEIRAVLTEDQDEALD